MVGSEEEVVRYAPSLGGCRLVTVEQAFDLGADALCFLPRRMSSMEWHTTRWPPTSKPLITLPPQHDVFQHPHGNSMAS